MENTEIIKTPVGVLRFGSLFEKDQFDRFSAGVVFDTTSFKPIGEALRVLQDNYLRTNQKLTAAPFYKQSKDIDGNPEAGKVLVTFKSNYNVNVVDSAGKKLKTDTNIGFGSEVRVAFRPVMQEAQGKAYVALYLSAVQVVKLVEYDPNPFAGDAVAGGFVADAEKVAEAVQNTDKPFDDEIPF